MKVLPVDSNQQSIDFAGAKIRKVRVQPRLREKINHEQNQNINYTQAILFSLAFIAAAFTKYFIDFCNGKHKQTINTEIVTHDTSSYQNTLQYGND